MSEGCERGVSDVRAVGKARVEGDAGEVGKARVESDAGEVGKARGEGDGEWEQMGGVLVTEVCPPPFRGTSPPLSGFGAGPREGEREG